MAENLLMLYSANFCSSTPSLVSAPSTSFSGMTSNSSNRVGEQSRRSCRRTKWK
ncbi:hypothetical protein A2U01_0109672, partial [Trifolium medium]|nr:hypothetical protein [Trifolium medium]